MFFNATEDPNDILTRYMKTYQIPAIPDYVSQLQNKILTVRAMAVRDWCLSAVSAWVSNADICGCTAPLPQQEWTRVNEQYKAQNKTKSYKFFPSVRAWQGALCGGRRVASNHE